MTTAFGPQGPNFSLLRPPADPKVSVLDTWHINCTSERAKDGTFPTADFFNVIIANLREAVRAAGIPLDDSNDSMLLQAIIALASVAPATQQEVNDGINTSKFVSPATLHNSTYFFLAEKGPSVAFPHNTPTLVTYTERFDLQSCYDSLTGEYTAPADGAYWFDFKVSGDNGYAEGVTGSLLVNGVESKRVFQTSSDPNVARFTGAGGSAIILLTAGDLVTTRVNQINSTAATRMSIQDTLSSARYFTGYRIV
jgi:hypothetical protein